MVLLNELKEAFDEGVREQEAKNEEMMEKLRRIGLKKDEAKPYDKKIPFQK